jgi:hypothetical protein
MAVISNKLKWRIVSNIAALLAAVLVRAIVSQSWRAIKHDDPPKNPESEDTQWKEAILWTLATAMTAGIARLLAIVGQRQVGRK